MAEGVLYVTDLDGTLLQADATLSARAHRLLTELLHEGAPITVATARGLFTLRHILGDLPLRLPVIELNGAFLTDLASGEHLWVHDLPTALAADIAERMRRLGLPPFLTTFDGAHDRLFAPTPVNAGMQWYVDERRALGDQRLHATDDADDALAQRVVCVTAIGERERLEPLVRYLDGLDGAVDYSLWENTYSPGWHWISVHDHRATKERAVAALVQRAGLGAVEVVAFGDQANDLGMLRAADRGIAVGNAIEAVRAVADEVIGPHGDDPVPRYIRHDWSARR